MIFDYISKTPLSNVESSNDGVFLNKNITEIKSLDNSNNIIAYQCLRLFINQNLNLNEVNENFDLVWKVYSETNYDGNIITDSLDTVKEYWQNKNLENFNQFLKDHPLLYSDGFYYGVEEVDRNEMMQQFQSYQIEANAGLNPTGIQWHNKKKACKEFTLEEFLGLSLAIKEYTLPYYNLMQERKEQIFDSEDKMNVLQIPVTYEQL